MILTNALYDKTDEGCLKVARSLVKGLKQKNPNTFVVSYGKHTQLSDRHLRLNKLLLNRRLLSLLRSRQERVLYIPFPARTIATAMRTFVLSLLSPKPVTVLWVMKRPLCRIAATLLRMSGADLVVLSKEAEAFFQEILPAERVHYLKTGVDTKRFVPVTPEESKALKRKYGFDPNRPVVLHVGHLRRGRGIDVLLDVEEALQAVLVVSTLTKEEQELDLKAALERRPNVRVMEDYLPHIEELYQLADVYLFPVTEEGNCIDVPLSCLEAASCGKPVVTTAYGEMRELIGCRGFYELKEKTAACVNALLARAVGEACPEGRDAVLGYDWDFAVEALAAYCGKDC